MSRHLLIVVLWASSLLTALAMPTVLGPTGPRVAAPTTLRVVDLRWLEGDPEMETRLGSLQGMLNAKGGESAIFLVRNANDAAWADTLARDYGLEKLVVTPGALLAEAKPLLKGQVLYDPAKPWSRNVALTAAAVTPDTIATDKDLGVPTALDLRNKWTNRLDAYRWLVETYAGKASGEIVLAPESGHLLADLITARKSLAIDLSPTDPQEAAALQAILAKLPAGARVLGSPDDRCGDADAAQARLAALLQGSKLMTLVPARDVPNLSCFARFPATRPLLQSRPEIALADGHRMLLLIYDGGSAAIGGGQALEQAYETAAALLDDPALANIPLGIEVPLSILDYAPPVYQWLISRQYFTRAELIAAPSGMVDPASTANPLADARVEIVNGVTKVEIAPDSTRIIAVKDMTGLSLLTTAEGDAYQELLKRLAADGWRGAVARPTGQAAARTNNFFPGFTALVANGRAATKAELRNIILTDRSQFLCLYLDPNGVTPGDIQELLPEINKRFTLITPSQAFSALEEAASVLPFLQKIKEGGNDQPQRRKPTLKVETPITSLQAPTAASAIPVTVRISGAAPVFLARLLYQNPDGRIGTTELHNAGQGKWTALLPPTLRGGKLTVNARIVEGDGFGITLTDPLILDIPVVDTDKDGADDTLEAYQGSDPRNPDSDRDGLPDGIDAQPMAQNRDFVAYYMPVYPPADTAFLVDKGNSTGDEQGRLIPAGGSVTYRLPLQDIPAARATLRLRADGEGTVSLNDGPAAPLDTLPGEITPTELPLAKPMRDKLTVKITAGAKPLRVRSLALISNPAGPYIRTVQLGMDFPPAGVPIPIRVLAYAPGGVKSARVRFTADRKAMHSLELKPVEDGSGVIFGASLPAQKDGALLIYNVEVEDTRGAITASPYQNVPIGLTRQHTVSFVGTRDIPGSWEPQPIWGKYGRVSTQGASFDTTQVLTRAGVYYVWILAQPRERGLAVEVSKLDALDNDRMVPRLSQTIPAGKPDGWYLLGKFSSPKMERLYAGIAPVGDKGYCAYGMLVLTQDADFLPPLTHAGLDWYNSVTIEGIQEGQTVSGTLKVTLRATGNLSAFDVKAIKGAKEYPFAREYDGTYVLDTRRLAPGVYAITATGYRVTTKNGMRDADEIVSVTVKVNVAGQ
ncbi:MAG: hypothetical protein ACYC7E_15910 [Armatimonadota bacterium]